jgi:ABC-type uncharacterized transport system involved in gliding motility auxiliary subunit
MNPKWQRFAPLGLYLAIVAALASAGYFIVEQQFNLPLQIGLGLIVIGLAIFAILDPDRVRRAFTGRQAKYGSNVLVMVVAFVGILAVINYLGNQYSKRWDLTADKTHTLAPETLKTLKSLPTPVTADAFFSQRTPMDSTKSVLEDYAYNSGGKFTYTFINPDQNPVAAQEAGITQDGSVVLHMGSHSQIVTSNPPSEQDMTSALVRLINPGQRNVYFLTGHGEMDPTGTNSSRSYAVASRALTSKNYTVKQLNLLTDHQVPSDATVVVVAGPQQPLAAEEIKPLQDYVNKGGALIVMEEPLPVTKFGSSPDPLADYLAQKWNIVLGNDIIVDQSSNNLAVAVGIGSNSSPITQSLNGTVSVFPTARSVTIKGDSTAESNATVLENTGQQSWAETDFTALANNQVGFDAAKDKAGPVPLAVSTTDPTQKEHLVVFGDSDFASDTAFSQYGNGDLFVNAVDWAAGQQNVISLTPKQTTNRVILRPQGYAINLILLGTVIVLPGLVLFSGILTWIQRRRRG